MGENFYLQYCYVQFRSKLNTVRRAKLLFTVLLSLLFSISFGAHLKGHITDTQTHEPIVGAFVVVKNTSLGTITGLDGSYELKNIPVGTHTIMVSQLGYLVMEQQVNVVNEKDVITTNFKIEENAKQLEEIVIAVEGDKESEQSTRRAEQKADNVVNIVGAKTIQLLPDITVGNILQRVSGVSIVRNSSGDGQYAIIRGMDKRYNHVLVNGVKIPSPDNKNRYVPLDIFPGDLLERLEVIKALTPNMEGDGIGGVMNLIMKSPPPSLTINGSFAGGFSNTINSNRPFTAFNMKNVSERSPVAIHGAGYQAKPEDFSVHQLQYSNRTMPMNSVMSLSIGNRILKDKLGFIVAGSYQSLFRGTNSIFYVPDEPAALPAPNTFLFQEVQIRKFSNQQKRLGLHAKIEYTLNKNNKITLYNLFSQLDEFQHRNYHNPLGAGVATNDIHDRSKFTRQRIYNSTLRGDHYLTEKIKMDWTLVYSIATSSTPAWSDMNVRYRYDNNSVLVSQELLPVTQIWTNNKDQDKTGYLNFTYMPVHNLEIMAGGLERFKTRNNVYTSYELGTLTSGGSYETYTSIDKAVFNFTPATNAYANPNDPNNYTAKENITAFYAQGKYNIGRLQLLGGVRNELTLQEYHSQLTVYAAGRDGKITYSDLLPSMHFKYALSEKQNVRLSYYKAISRPNYFEFVPTEISGDVFTEAGNYKIKHTKADNYDLRYEMFSQGNNQLLAGAFYKKIYDPIEYGFVPVTVSSSNVIPQNYGTATNYGFEFVVTKYLRNWGVSANYTYTKSSLIQAKKYKATVTASDGSTTIQNSLRNQDRPLQGQSNHIANASLLYKNPKLGFDAQLSWVYTGRRINIVSPYKDLDYWQRGFSQIDFSAEKKIYKKFQRFKY